LPNDRAVDADGSLGHALQQTDHGREGYGRPVVKTARFNEGVFNWEMSHQAYIMVFC
jgi:hypothetical protein